MTEINQTNKNIKSLEDYYLSKNPQISKDKLMIKTNENNLLLYVITYNMKGKTPSEEDIPSLFPKDINKFDIYVISTQECLRSITASMFISSKDKWISLLSNFFGENFMNLINSNLGATHLSIFAKKEKAKNFHELRSGEIETGFMNWFSNKGAVSGSMKYLDKHILFIGCHLAAGQDKSEKRNEDLLRIKTTLRTSINFEAKDKLKKHKANIDIKKSSIIKNVNNNELNNDNITKKFSKSVVLKQNKTIQFNEEQEEKKDNNKIDINNKINEGDDKSAEKIFDEIKEVESKKDEENNNNIDNLKELNVNLNKDIEIKMTELFENKKDIDKESCTSISIEEKMKEKSMDDYDFVIISGDLNYRLDFEHGVNIEEIMNKKNPEILWEKDQFSKEIKKEHELKEGIINFMPTFKYKVNSNEYDYEREPGWTDRILFKSKKLYDIMLCDYSCLQDVDLSDHKPVYAVFKINFKNKEVEHNINIKSNINDECILF